MTDHVAALQNLKKSAHNAGDVDYALRGMRLRSTKEFFHAIGAWAKVREWPRVLDLIDDMRKRGVRPDMYCYSAALAALDKARQPKRALQLFQDMKIDGCARRHALTRRTRRAR